MSGRAEFSCDALDKVIGAIPPWGVNRIGVNDVDDEPSCVDPCRAYPGVGPIDENSSICAQKYVVGSNGAMDNGVTAGVAGCLLYTSPSPRD